MLPSPLNFHFDAFHKPLYRFVEAVPGLLESEHGGVHEGRAHLQVREDVKHYPYVDIVRYDRG